MPKYGTVSQVLLQLVVALTEEEWELLFHFLVPTLTQIRE